MVMMWGGLVGHWDAVDSLNGFISLFLIIKVLYHIY